MVNYNELLDIHIPYEFGSREDYDDSTAIDIAEENIINIFGANIRFEYGATMFVIIDEDPENKKVAKIPFNGEFAYYEEEDDDYSEEHFKPFFYNYANRTIDIYDNAEYADVEKMFAKCEVIGKTCGFPVFVQDFVVPVREIAYNDEPDDIRVDIPTPSEDSRKKYNEKLKAYNSKWDSYWHRFNANWLCNAIDCYGFDYVERFIQFCHDSRLNDFHNGNIGYRLDGTPCVLDWAGYDED